MIHDNAAETMISAEEQTTEGKVFATVSKPWMEYYSGSTEGILSLECDAKQTVWKNVEHAMQTIGLDQDAMIYFGRHYSRQEFIAMVRKWARTFKGMGIRPEEHVLLFAPFSPQIAAMILALNAIGATVVMPNMHSSKESIKACAAGTRYAICLDSMYDRIAGAHDSFQFEKTIIVTASTGMSEPMRLIAWLANARVYIHALKAGRGRNITVRQVIRTYGKTSDSFEEPFVSGRVAMVTASGGTTLNGQAKLIQCTNESIMSLLENVYVSAIMSGIRPESGDKALNMLPPFVSTSELVLFLAPLMIGATVIAEPRLTPSTFADNNLKYRPQITLMPGKGWEAYFAKVRKLIAKGRRPDLSHWKLPIVGGEGCTPQELAEWNSIMKECGAKTNIMPGYGMSEGFSVMSVDFNNYDYLHNERDCIQVGRPLSGITMAVFDKDGNELPAGRRGELWVRTPSMMKGYLNDANLSKQVMKGGWLHTGDLFEMDNSGEFFCYGRMDDYIMAANGVTVYTFDIANRLRKDPDVRLALVNNMSHPGCEPPFLVAHIVMNTGMHTSRKELIERLQNDMAEWLPAGLTISGYYIHKESTFSTSPVMKTDKNRYKKIHTGYQIVCHNELKEVRFKI